MSCRIDRVVSAENRVVLFISGRITGEHVDTFRGVLEQESGGFAIDLKNVLLVDREAVKLLALGEANGMELRNCPPYIREWVTRERAETPERPSEQGLGACPRNAKKISLVRRRWVARIWGVEASFADRNDDFAQGALRPAFLVKNHGSWPFLSALSGI